MRARVISPELLDIVKSCAMYYNITPDDIMGISRDRAFVTARHLYCFIARKHTTYSMGAIGEIIGRDHSTVVYAWSKVYDEMEFYPEIREAYSKVVSILEKEIANPYLVAMNELGKAYVYTLTVDFNKDFNSLLGTS